MTLPARVSALNARAQALFLGHPRLAALALGGLSACGFEPLHLWPLTLAALALLLVLAERAASPRQVALLGWLFGLRGLSLAVMLVAASLPVGANVFLFAQRYGVAQEEITASIAVSTALALLTLPMVLLVAARLV